MGLTPQGYNPQVGTSHSDAELSDQAYVLQRILDAREAKRLAGEHVAISMANDIVATAAALDAEQKAATAAAAAKCGL